MKTYTANQPLALGGQAYMWNRYLNVDVLVHMTTAQLSKFGHQSRIELTRQDGSPQMFIIPLRNKSFKPIGEVELVNPPHTLDGLFKTLQSLYSHSMNYMLVMESLHKHLLPVVNREGVTLGEFNRATHDAVKEMLCPTNAPFKDVVDIEVLPKRPEHPSEWVAELGVAVNCTEYIGGGTAQSAYIREEDFSSRGMTFKAQNYHMKPYPRKYGTVTKPRVDQTNSMISVLDMLMCIPWDEAHDLLKGEQV